jgi:hypothetical protein
MSEMVKRRVSEMDGAQLDYAVLTARGYKHASGPWHVCGEGCVSAELYHPSTDWMQGGPLIESEKIWLAAPLNSARREWSASLDCSVDHSLGPTPLIAAMRAFVASKLGDEVEVPE